MAMQKENETERIGAGQGDDDGRVAGRDVKRDTSKDKQQDKEEDLIDFGLIEPQKENIQSLPSGRSAKALASLYSPRALQPLATPTPVPGFSSGLNAGSNAGSNVDLLSPIPQQQQQQPHIATARAQFEQELANISESDDPLDVYDRYVRWTVETFPSAQASSAASPSSGSALTSTSASSGGGGLWPLLERATSAFLGADYEHYANDPRYLRIWLHYIRLQAAAAGAGGDGAVASKGNGAVAGAGIASGGAASVGAGAIRETFAFLARRGIGERLALYYEEFAAWLESRGRWVQAEEMYELGLQKKARPAERLARKKREFEARWEVVKASARQEEQAGDVVGPRSPAIPPLRPALAPVVGVDAEDERDPQQQQQQQQQQSRGARGGKKGKLAVFSDKDGDADAGAGAGAGGIGEASGWESIGSLAERKKENTIAPRPWAGETLKTGKTNAGAGKMMVYKDEEEHEERIRQQQQQSQPQQGQQHSHQKHQHHQHKSRSPNQPVALEPHQKKGLTTELRHGSSSSNSINISSSDNAKKKNHMETVNPRTGRRERVFVNLELVYPDPKPDGSVAEEFCFEELRARHRGWLGRDWKRERLERKRVEKDHWEEERKLQAEDEEELLLHQRRQRGPFEEHEELVATKSVATKESVDVEAGRAVGSSTTVTATKTTTTTTTTEDQARALADEMRVACRIEDGGSGNALAVAGGVAVNSGDAGSLVADMNDENAPPSKEELEKAALARKLRREERANRTRKIKVMEVKGATQTIQTNLDSPTGPKIRRRKSTAAEPTMTVNTREAMDEIYGIFNQPADGSGASDGGAESEFSDAEDDDYTSAGDSTETGRISATTTEYDDDYDGDDTRAELTEGTSTIGDVDDVTVGGVGDVGVGDDDEGEGGDGEDTKSVSAWSDFTASKHVPKSGLAEQQQPQSAEGGDRAASAGFSIFTDSHNEVVEGQASEALVTPTTEEPPSTVELSLPHPPVDYNVPTRPYRDETQIAHSRLPFMTPIIEKTESSLGGITGKGPGTNKRDYHHHHHTSKTPSRTTQNPKTPTIPEAGPELWSSPFEDVTREDGFEQHEKVKQPVLLQRASEVKGKALPLQPKGEAAKDSGCDALSSKGPAIPDLQCNPMDEGIRATIIEKTYPPIETYSGYFEDRQRDFGKEAEIRKFTKSLAKAKGGAAGDRTSMNISHPPVIELPGAKRQYTIKRELGKGAYAPVFLVDSALPDNEDSANSLEDSDEQSCSSQSGEGQQQQQPQQQLGVIRQPLEALKMENPPTAWEFFMLRQTHRRLGVSRAAESIIHAHEMHLFRDECYLILQYRNQGTLLDVVNLARSSPNGIDGISGSSSTTAGNHGSTGLHEPLALFFVAELLRTVEAMHARGIIHGDIKPDNVLVRLDALPDIPWTARYQRDGRGGWSAKGITLIDFGRAIDTRAFQTGATFVADWEAGLADCPEIRELRPWTYQIDYYGLAGVVHSLLFGKYMETVVDKGDGGGVGVGAGVGIGIGAAKTYRIRESLKRYWQTEIWADLLDLLLNPGRHVAGEDGGRMPVVKGLRGLRERIEDWLEANCEKGVGLKASVRKLEGAIKERRK